MEVGIISKRAGASGSIQGRDVAAAPTSRDNLMKRIKGKDKRCRARQGSLKETSNDEKRLRVQAAEQLNIFLEKP